MAADGKEVWLEKRRKRVRMERVEHEHDLFARSWLDAGETRG